MSDFDDMVREAHARYAAHEAESKPGPAGDRERRMAEAEQTLDLARRCAREATASRFPHEHELVSEELVASRSLFRTKYVTVWEQTDGWALVGPRRVMVFTDRGQLYYADGVLLTEAGTILVFGQGHIGRDMANTGIPNRDPVPQQIRLMEDDGVLSWTYALDTPTALADADGGEISRFAYLARSTRQYGPIPVTLAAIKQGLANLVARSQRGRPTR